MSPVDELHRFQSTVAGTIIQLADNGASASIIGIAQKVTAGYGHAGEIGAVVIIVSVDIEGNSPIA